MERRVFDKDTLKSVNTMAQVQGYNRSMQDVFMDSLPEKLYVPCFTMIHEHKQCKPCEPHVRCVFKHDGDYFIIDVEMGCWELLPTMEQTMAAIEKIKAERPPEKVG